MAAGGHGDVGRMGTVRHMLHQAMLPTPMASDRSDSAGGGSGSTYPLRAMLATPRKSDGERGGRGDLLAQLQQRAMKHAGTMLTPTKTGNLTAPSMQKWAGARALARMLASHGLTGTAALPITYGWMMGFPPGWLSAAALQAASSPPSATRSSRKSRKASGEQSGE
jgi:hypothetical protein